MIAEYFKLALGNLLRRKLRSSLTIIGILISIATIFVLISLSLGLDQAIKEQFRQLGTDKFFIQPKGQAGAPGSGGAAMLTTKDAEIVEKVNGVEGAAYFTIGNAKIEYKNKPRYYMVLGMPTDSKVIDLVFEAMNINVEEGRFIRADDKKKVLLGYDYKYGNLFSKPLGTNDKIELNDVEFEVIGVLEAIGNPADDQQVYISNGDFKELFNSGDRVDMIWVQVKEGEDVVKVSEDVKRKLMNYRGVKEKTIDFSISTPEEILKSFSVILNIVTAFLVGVAGISLLVGSIGIANTMFTSVLERTKEIGTMKAIGAKNSDIRNIFVIESGLLGLIGGATGILLGIGIGKIIEFIAVEYVRTNLLRTYSPLWLIAGCLAFGFLIGSLSGYFPAVSASKLKPADTLRYE